MNMYFGLNYIGNCIEMVIVYVIDIIKIKYRLNKKYVVYIGSGCILFEICSVLILFDFLKVGYSVKKYGYIVKMNVV